METQKQPDASRAPVQLQIAGGGLLLNGTFKHWLPVLMEGTRDSTNTVQLLIDVTSLPETGPKEQPLFTFRSRKVRAVAPQSSHMFSALGTLDSGRNRDVLQAFVQAPDDHTPFLLLTMELPREGYAEIWQAFDDRVAQRDQDATEVRALAWLRPPDVAAA